MGFIERLGDGREFLLFAVTPPRRTTAPERVQEIAEATMARLDALDLDGLILYDIDDESDRNPTERPFPFTPTLDPADYLTQNLGRWQRPVIVYRSVGKYTASDLESWLARQDPTNVATVLVGAASQRTSAALSLAEGLALHGRVNPGLTLGGVAIPERHSRRGDEHVRLLGKQEAGAGFFVTQVIYDVNAAKNLVSDYVYEARHRGMDPAPIAFTFSVCGSMKTLEFLRWLGVDVPRWIENELKHAGDTLEASYRQALVAAEELLDFCRTLGVTCGFNVESVSIRKVEIDASVRLARELRSRLNR